MYNYHTDLIWTADLILIGTTVVTAVVAIGAALFNKYFWRWRTRELLHIKQHIYGIILRGEVGTTATCTMPLTPQRFLDINANRARNDVSFNNVEQQLFKSCFVTAEQVARLERTARRSISKWRRIEAILCLGYAELTPAIPTLATLLYHADEDISYFSLLALGQIKVLAAARELLVYMRSAPQRCAKIVSLLVSFPATIGDEVVALTNDAHAEIRMWALRLLQRFATAEHCPALERLLEDAVPEVRAAACECLAATGVRAMRPVLVARLGDESWLVRMHAVRSLVRLMGDEAMSDIIGCISDASWAVNGAVKNAMIAHIHAALPYIERFVRGDDIVAQRYSVEALKKSGYLTQLLRDAVQGTAADKARAQKLLEGLVAMRVHFGIEAALGGFDVPLQTAVIAIIRAMDPVLATHIMNKLSHTLDESAGL